MKRQDERRIQPSKRMTASRVVAADGWVPAHEAFRSSGEPGRFVLQTSLPVKQCSYRIHRELSGVDRPNAREILDANTPRMLGDGVPYPDIVRIRSTIAEWRQWFPAWEGLATDYELSASHAQADGFSLTAGELYWQASLAHHYAQFMWFEWPAERERGQLRKVELYRRAAPLFEPPALRVEIPFEETIIPAYLRVPSSTSPSPCVVLIGGLESTKEESYQFENMCLRRGIATFAFDGPGQGEYFAARGMVPDFERYAGAVLDQLMHEPAIDSSRIAVLGRSLGGYYAVRSAAMDPRFAACVAWGALYNLDFFESIEHLTQLGFRSATKIQDVEAAESRAKECVNLDGVAQKLKVPLYVLHGQQDPLIPVSQVGLLNAAVTSAPKTIVIEPDGDHCCHNMYSRVRFRMADWLAYQLSASGWHRTDRPSFGKG
jgi:2,6-dihydroxypseudooxynicotine hydrolase